MLNTYFSKILPSMI